MDRRFQGCYTALVTPMLDSEAREVDYAALEQLVEFQVAAGISGVLAMGTTGESPTLNWDEHCEVIVRTARFAGDRCDVIAGTGSNSTAECLSSTHHAVEHGIDAILLVEPYYNGPSSLEIRREYMAPVARRFPDVQFIPYVIPGRTGTQLLPEDLALLAQECANVGAVKEASESLDNMRRTREVCGPDFTILSGDDNQTHSIMTEAAIGAAGVVSVASNVVPAAIQQMTQAVIDGDLPEASRLKDALAPLFGVLTVKTQEDSPHGPRLCKARNPLPIKTLMRLLGMPSGPPRRPLGRMTPAGLERVVSAARQMWESSPELLTPVADAFGVDIEARLSDPAHQRGLCYED